MIVVNNLYIIYCLYIAIIRVGGNGRWRVRPTIKRRKRKKRIKHSPNGNAFADSVER